MTHLELRKKFKEFFKSKNHAIEKSSSFNTDNHEFIIHNRWNVAI